MITEKMLADAAAEVHLAILDGLPDEAECTHVFSVRFQKRMKRVFKMGRHPIQYQVMQKAACFLLVLFLGFSFLTAVSPRVRAAVLSWVKAQYANLTQYYLHPGTSAGQSSLDYTLGYLPEGYVEVSRTETRGCTTVYYANYEENRILYFTYSNNAKAASFFFDYSASGLEKIQISGFPADYYASDNAEASNAICWNSPDTTTFFGISAFLEKRELIKIAENIKILEN